MIEQKDEAVFDFSETQKQLATQSAQLAEKREKKEQRKQQTLDASYVRNRREILAKAKLKNSQNRPEQRIKNSWQSNFEALPEVDQVRIDELNLDYRVALSQAIETIAGKNTIPPDEMYRLVADFVAVTGRGDSFSDISLLANLSGEDFEAATGSSPNIRLYGRPTQLPGLIFDVFSESCWNWCRANKDICNPLAYAELAAKFPEPEPQPAPPSSGLKQSTRSEEAAAQAQREFITTQQRIMYEGTNA